MEKITRKTFIENATFGDTTTYIIYDSQKIMRYRGLKLPYTISVNNKDYENVTHLTEEHFRSDGSKKVKFIIDTATVSKEFYYNKEGNIQKEIFYNRDETNSTKLKLTFKMLKIRYGDSYTFNKYKDGILYKKSHYKKNKKDGIWEYYDKETGKLIKKVVYKDGKKQE